MSNIPVFIRTASKRDLPAIRDLLIETWHHTYDAIFGEDVVKTITDEWCSLATLEAKLIQPESEFVVADTGQALTGMAFAKADAKTVTLHQLYVHPDHQGQGVGTELMQELFFCFDQAERMELDVHPKNENAIGFYKAGGFVETGNIEVPGPEGMIIPHVVLSRNLDD